ncbi:hypothetical protein ONZ51_g13362 [Trametes cubensis]|uniref:Fungal-type protein kinase domain-containing protein n=1 Tax=Trametes cubensis TaxID=1111947 RepID=A0AAD7TGN9_9APHY|nr:hypothetical protein ONZ51_g13362 [Trametes cubensis]
MEETQHIRTVPTRDFLDRIMPVGSEQLERIYDAVMRYKDKLYTRKRWQTFPQAEKQYEELDIYPAFVETANVIAKVARDEAGEREDQVREAIWVGYHAEVPQTPGKDAAPIPPDCALAMAFADPSQAPSETRDKLRWLQVVAAVEAKRDFDQKDKELISQLLAHLRVIMVEQKDRRFALGLYLSNTQASVWLQDRAGALGMDVPIDIHENPRDFIQVIAAFAILPAHRLGFDPTMKLAREPLPPIYTYRLTSQVPDHFNLGQYKETNVATQWVITTEQGDFTTLRVLNLLRADVASGSGCIIWAAIRYEDRDMDPDERKVFVFKQLWKSDGLLDEGAIYEHLKSVSGDPDAQYVGKFEFHEVVKIGNEVDNTDRLIRRGLDPVPMQMEEQQPYLTHPGATDSESDVWYDVEFLEVDGIQVTSRIVARRRRKMKPPVNCTRVRIVLGVLGRPIEFFSSVRELVSLLLDCVRGHRFAYEHGVVHRDISTGNLLIALKGHHIPPSSRSDSQVVQGCLIDFDHAKRTQTVEERKVIYDADKIRRLTNLKLHHANIEELAEQVTDDVVLRAVHLVKQRFPNTSTSAHVAMYIEAALQRYKASGRPPPSNNLYTPEMLGWDGPLLRPPLPLRSVTQPAGEVRSGTPPFISPKILKLPQTVVVRWRDSSSFPTSSVVHDAIHDMESFFWVLLFFCITRGGPGGGRRKELEGELDTFPAQDRDEVQQIRRINHCLFGGDMETIACNKAELFLHPEDFEEHVLPYVHPYFEHLKLMLRRWWDLLVLAYAFEGYEYHNIHALVIEILDEAASALASQAGVDSQEAMENRAKYLHDTTHAIAASHDQSTTPPSSPLSDLLDITTPESKKRPYKHIPGSLQSTSHDSSPLSSPPSSPLAKKSKRGD